MQVQGTFKVDVTKSMFCGATGKSTIDGIEDNKTQITPQHNRANKNITVPMITYAWTRIHGMTRKYD